MSAVGKFAAALGIQIQTALFAFILSNSSSHYPVSFISKYKGFYALLFGVLFSLGAVYTLRQERKSSRFMSFEAVFLVALSLGVCYVFCFYPQVALPVLFLNASQLFIHIPGDVYKKIIRIACLAVILLAALAIVVFTTLNIAKGEFASAEENKLSESPEGRFELILVKSREGTPGGSQTVLVRAIKPQVDLGAFGCFMYQQAIYKGSLNDSFTASFEDDFHVIINGQEIYHPLIRDYGLLFPGGVR